MLIMVIKMKVMMMASMIVTIMVMVCIADTVSIRVGQKNSAQRRGSKWRRGRCTLENPLFILNSDGSFCIERLTDVFRLAPEYELYVFVEQRLEQQYR